MGKPTKKGGDFMGIGKAVKDRAAQMTLTADEKAANIKKLKELFKTTGQTEVVVKGVTGTVKVHEGNLETIGSDKVAIAITRLQGAEKKEGAVIDTQVPATNSHIASFMKVLYKYEKQRR